MLVADHLRAAIVEGEIQEGDTLPSEAVLMQQFDVSRPTLREALRVLESEGLLTVMRGSVGGFRVHTPTPEVAAQFAGRVLKHRRASVEDILEARSILEPQCARSLAQRRAASDLERLQECLWRQPKGRFEQTPSSSLSRGFTNLSSNFRGTRPSSSCPQCCVIFSRRTMYGPRRSWGLRSSDNSATRRTRRSRTSRETDRDRATESVRNSCGRGISRSTMTTLRSGASSASSCPTAQRECPGFLQS